MVRITLTQRLKQLGYRSYNAYLRSPHWHAIRQYHYRAATRDAQGRMICVNCYRPGQLHLHHKTYIRLGRELPSDLVLLCAECHDKAHGRQLKRKRANRSKLQRFPTGVRIVQVETCRCGAFYFSACTCGLHF